MIEIEPNNLSRLEKASKDLQVSLYSGWEMEQLVLTAVKIQQQRTSELFAIGGKPEWEDISYWTRKRRIANQDGKPMTETGSLNESITSKDGNSGSVRIQRHGSNFQYELGSSEERARALQSPLRKRKIYDSVGRWSGSWENMPARPFLYFERSTVNKMNKEFENRLQAIQNRFHVAAELGW